MKAAILAFLFFLSNWGGDCARAAQSDSMKRIELSIVSVVAGSEDVIVRLSNPAEKPLRIWQNSNSWGAGRWRILLVRAGRLTVLTPHSDDIFTVNMPIFQELKKGGKYEETLKVNADHWYSSSGSAPRLATGDMVTVIYDVPVTSEAAKMNVWMGFVGDLVTVP